MFSEDRTSEIWDFRPTAETAWENWDSKVSSSINNGMGLDLLQGPIVINWDEFQQVNSLDDLSTSSAFSNRFDTTIIGDGLHVVEVSIDERYDLQSDIEIDLELQKANYIKEIPVFNSK